MAFTLALNPTSGTGETTITATTNVHTGRSIETKNVIAKVNNVAKNILPVYKLSDYIFSIDSNTYNITSTQVQLSITGKCNRAGFFCGKSTTEQSECYIDTSDITSNSPFASCSIILIPRSSELSSSATPRPITNFKTVLSNDVLEGCYDVKARYTEMGDTGFSSYDYGEKAQWTFTLSLFNIPNNTTGSSRSFNLYIRKYDGTLLQTVTITQAA